MPTLNGRLYTYAQDFANWAHSMIKAGTGKRVFPDAIFDDFLAELQLQMGGITLDTPAIAAGVLTLAAGTKNAFRVNLNANVATLTIDPAGMNGNTRAFWLILDIGGAYTITWPASVKWAAGIPPTLTATVGKVDVFTMLTTDGGATWLAFRAGQSF